MLKHVLAFFAILLVSLSSSQAKDDKWIDGIKIKMGQNTQNVNFTTDSDDATGYDGEVIIKPDEGLEGQKAQSSLPIAIVLPETLMNSYSFRGAFIEYKGKSSISDVAPRGNRNGLL